MVTPHEGQMGCASSANGYPYVMTETTRRTPPLFVPRASVGE
jgi:hypothetical protein